MLLSKVTDESTVTSKELIPTRWAGRLLTVLCMKHNYITILKLLTAIISNQAKEKK